MKDFIYLITSITFIIIVDCYALPHFTKPLYSIMIGGLVGIGGAIVGVLSVMLYIKINKK